MNALVASKRRRLGRILGAVFVLALIMGPGPGILLINPRTTDSSSAALLLGMPIVYVWAVFWFAVQATVVVTAYRCLWNSPNPE